MANEQSYNKMKGQTPVERTTASIQVKGVPKILPESHEKRGSLDLQDPGRKLVLSLQVAVCFNLPDNTY